MWQNRGQFFGVAAQMMRRILVDRARARKMAKRSGQWARVTVDDAAKATPPLNVDVLDLDAALARLAEFDPRSCQLAELRFLAGCHLRRPATRWGFPRDGRARLAGGAGVVVQGITAGAPRGAPDAGGTSPGSFTRRLRATRAIGPRFLRTPARATRGCEAR